MSVLLAPEQTTNVDQSVAGRETAPRALREARRPTRVERMFRDLVLRRLADLREGHLHLVDADNSFRLGRGGGLSATLRVHDPRLYRMLVLGGSLAASEAYLRGYWDSDDLSLAMRILARHADVMTSMERGATRWLKPFRWVLNGLRRNTRSGSRRNIAAHYDLSNEFFELMLDRTMTYSSGIFESPASTLEEASVAKYDRICQQLHMGPRDHVLEVGCGWGGFAIHAARNFGCRVTATTISQQQFRYAQRRIDQAGLSQRITLVLQDYRDLTGRFDKLVSIEMIEAVGEQFFDTYFGQCSRLLKADGKMLLQAITMPDHRFDRYRRSVDFIQRYIFPGGFLPCFSAIGRSLRRATDLRVTRMEDFGLDYAQTLARWRDRFWENIDRVRELGFDERFIRTWHYYLCFCEAGFRERQVGVSHLLLAKPKSGVVDNF